MWNISYIRAPGRLNGSFDLPGLVGIFAMRSYSVWFVSTILLLALAACSTVSSVTPSPAATPTKVSIFFPQLKSPDNERGNVAPSALLTGTLVNADGCLRVIADPDGSSYLAIWPDSVTLIFENDSIEIHNLSGELLARVGDRIRLSGGELAASEAGWVSTLLQPGQELPEACPGPYWLVGNEISLK
jgi:hypothetical protein